MSCVADHLPDYVLKPNYYQQPCSASTLHIVRKLTGVNPDRYDECKDLIKELELDYFTGAAVKYLWRCEKKNAYMQDLGKAIEHLKERPKATDRSQAIHEIRGLIVLATRDGDIHGD